MMERYERNIIIDGFGRAGQEKLARAKVLVVGAGGLGSPVIMYLAAAGIGTLGIVDHDTVDVTNLQRQIIHGTGDIDRRKVDSARDSVGAVNPDMTVITYPEKFTGDNAAELVAGYDFVVDCCDNYDAKYLINDVCVACGKPYSHGAILAMRGEAMTYVPGHADYRAVFPSPPEDGMQPTAAQAGALGAIAGVIGSVQAAEVIKYITGIGELLTDRILIVNGLTMTFNTLRVKAR